jgi:hypothetical protein
VFLDNHEESSSLNLLGSGTLCDFPCWGYTPYGILRWVDTVSVKLEVVVLSFVLMFFEEQWKHVHR